MLRFTSALGRRIGCWAAVAGLIFAAPVAGQAQSSPSGDQPSHAEPPAPKMSLDFQALLTSDKVLGDKIDDPVWQLRSSPGRRLIELPLALKPVPGKTAKLDNPPPIKVRAGIFVGYQVPAVKTDRQAPATGWAPGTGGGAGFGGGGGDQWARGPSANAGGGAPQGAPRVARELTLSPEGVLSWDLARGLPGAQVRSGESPYQLKLRPNRLRDMQPKRPARKPRGADQDRRDYLNQRRAAMADYRDKARAFLTLQKRVRDLSDHFSAPNPPRVWALFQVVDSFQDLTVQGPKPLPWEISFADLKLLRDVAGGRPRSGPGGGLSREGQIKVNRLRDLARRDDHPMTRRAIAHALVLGDLAGKATLNDPLYRLLAELIHGHDAKARRTVLRGLATTLPPTPATAGLLREAADQMGPHLKLLALRSLFRAAGGEGGGDRVSRARDLVTTANRSLQNLKGPPARDVIAELIAAMAKGQSDQGLDAVAQGVDFTAIPDPRRPGVIAVVVAAAPTQPIASRWLSEKLLASPKSAVVSLTTRIIAAAQAPKPQSESPRNRGGPHPWAPPSRPRHEADKGIARALVSQVEMPEDPTRHLPVVTLTGRIPIGSTNHGIYQVLNSADSTINASAWEGLDHFVISGDGGHHRRYRPGGSDHSPGPDRFDMILSAALDQHPTPAGVVRFLAHQPQTNQGTAALIRVAAGGDAQTARKAVAVLMGSDRPIAEVLGSLPRDTREGFARRLYSGNPAQAPLVTGLARTPGDHAPVVQWLGEQVAKGRVPKPAAWAQAVREPGELLDLAAAKDPALAKGAVAALARAAGGDAQTAADLANRFASLKDRSAKAVAAQWAKAKKDIYAARLASAAGSYRMGFAVTAPDYDHPKAQAASVPPVPPSKVKPIAVVDLTATSDSIRFADQTVTLSIPTQRFAIRIAHPAELKNFDNPALASLPLDKLKGPIDLLPNGPNAWRAVVKLPNGHWLHLRLDPTKQ